MIKNIFSQSRRRIYIGCLNVLPKKFAALKIIFGRTKRKMKITICSRKTICDLIKNDSLKSSAVISFCDPPDSRKRFRDENYCPVNLNGLCARVLYVCVYDLDIEALSDFGLTPDTYYTEAKEVAEFVKKAVSDGLEIVCQCEYGQSRSAGCAAAILQYYEKDGISVFANYKYYPNHLIYNKTYSALCEK